MKLATLRPPFFSTKSKEKKDKKTRTITLSDPDPPSIGSGSEYSTVSTPRSVLQLNEGKMVVTRKGLEVVLRRLNSTEEEVAAILAEAAEEEVVEMAEAADEAELRETFAVFDADGDGKISAEELMSLFAVLGDDCCSLDDCRRMIGGVDTDGDGFVCFDEFVSMMDGQR
ncbi:uncharacterized protein [Typha angustifolia]|uniref:uncharacterized protein n=1 Tax=Typha angustifolia TaxID=59011 RepID=UPI003C2FBD10